MKQKLLLSLMMLAVAASMNAQDEMDRTLPPNVMTEYYSSTYHGYYSDDHYDEFFLEACHVTIEPADDDVTTIYYRTIREGEEPTYWMEFDGEPLIFTYYGDYVLEAYAQAEGKLPSEIVSVEFYVIDDLVASHFHVNGIFYKSYDHETLEVTTDFECGDIMASYSGDIIIPGTVEIEGNIYTVTSIAGNTFASQEVSSVVLPNTLETIQSQAFYGSGISEINIPASVYYIEDEAFAECQNLTRITVNPNNAYYDSRNDCNAIIATRRNILCVGCQNTAIPNTVTIIGDGAFLGATGLTTMVIPGSVTEIGNNAFRGCTGLANVEIPNSVTSIGAGAFQKCSALTSVVIPNSVTSLGQSAFAACANLTDVKIPNTITSISSSLFGGCTALANIEIPASVTQIGSSAFYACRSLTDVVIPDSVTSVGYVAFSECTGLKTVTIGKSVTSLSSSFKGCTAMTSMTVRASTPPSVNHVFTYLNNSEDYLYDQVSLYVSQESLDAYRNHKTWGKFTHIVPFIGAGPGDVDGDGHIDISDVTDLIDQVLSGQAPAYCDVDGDGKVNISDLTVLIDMILTGNM